MELINYHNAEIRIIDDQLNSIHYMQWNPANNEHARFIQVTTTGLSPLCKHYHDNSIYISKNWQSQFLQNVTYQSENRQFKLLANLNVPIYDYNGAQNCQTALYEFEHYKLSDDLSTYFEALSLVSNMSETINGTNVNFYIPSAGQFNIIYHNIREINRALEIIGAEEIELGTLSWITSTSYSEDEMCCFYLNDFFALDKSTPAYVLPIADLYPAANDNITFVVDDNGEEIPVAYWNSDNTTHARYIKINVPNEEPIYISANFKAYLNTYNVNYNFDFSKFNVESTYNGFEDFNSLFANDDQKLKALIANCDETFLCSKAKAYIPSLNQLKYIQEHINQVNAGLFKIGIFDVEGDVINVDKNNFICTSYVEGMISLYIHEGTHAENKECKSLILHSLSDIDNSLEISVIDSEENKISIDNWDSSRDDAQFLELLSPKLPYPMLIYKNFIYRIHNHIWQEEENNINGFPNIPNLQQAELDFDGLSNQINAINGLTSPNHQGYSYIDTYNNIHKTKLTPEKYLPGVIINDYPNDLDYIPYYASIGQLKMIFQNKDVINAALSKIKSNHNLDLPDRLNNKDKYFTSSTPAYKSLCWGIADGHVYKIFKNKPAHTFTLFAKPSFFDLVKTDK